MSEKNFRSNYYEKVGFKSVDVKKSLESILNDAVIEKARLAQFLLKYEVPAQYRVAVWKFLLDVTSCNKEASNFVWQQRREQYEILLKSLRAMRRLAPPNDDDDETDIRQRLSLVLALEENRLPWAECSDVASTVANANGQSISNAASPKRRLTAKETEWEEDFDVVFEVVEEALTVEDEVETYWLCRNLHKILTRRRKLVQAQMKELESYLWRSDSQLAAHLENGNFWRWPPTPPIVIDFLRLAFASVFRFEAVLSLWDKVVAGGAMSEVFVLAEILLAHRTSILSTPANLVVEKTELITREIPIMNQHALIDRALEIWQTEFGGVLQPNSATPMAGLHSAVVSTNPSPVPAASAPTTSTSNVETRYQKMSVDMTSSSVNRAASLKQRKFSHFMKM